METIKTYLNSMFANLPDTAEIRRAKEELYSIMEDKYSELIGEGKSESEAIATVISEFGNLDELADSLGINHIFNEVVTSGKKALSEQEVNGFITAFVHKRLMIGFGVMFCICSVVGPVLFAPVSALFHAPGIEGIGVGLMFILIAVGVGLFILSGYQLNDWKYINSNDYMIDSVTSDVLMRAKDEDQVTRSLTLTAGIMLCIVSVVPVIVFSLMFGGKLTLLSEGLGPSMIFVLTGIGVLFIIISGARSSAFNKLLSLGNNNA